MMRSSSAYDHHRLCSSTQDNTTDTLLVGRVAIIPPELVTSASSVHEDVQGIVAQRITSYAIIPSNRRAAYVKTSERGSFGIARVVCNNKTSSLGVIGLPTFHIVVFDSSAYCTVQNDTACAEWSACWLGMYQFVVPETHVLDSRIEERSVAGIADFVVFNLCTVRLDAVAM